ncbi:olfactory receptor 52L1-like [Sardina pilchardus]|uniref:olfactory receptor 52L1-like n=1 Tax=Sardina pilchardus TaxID=27697 RepID=UPI002E145902
MGSPRYLLLAVVILTYFATVLANVTLMLLIFLDTSLHKPMHIFLFSLILNGLMGSTAVWPMVMNILLTNSPLISYEGCLIQAFFIITYGSCNFSMLTVMAYDRFVSIFKPLQYHTIMTPKRVKQLLFLANVGPTALVLFQICLSSQLSLCRYKVNKLYCDNVSITRLSCGGSHAIKNRISNLYGIVCIIVIVALPMVLIVSSYVKIIMFTFKASKTARKKTFDTCFSHIIVFINFSLVTLFSLIYNRLSAYLPGEYNIVASINYILVPPLLHPIIYGIKTKEFRQRFSRAWRKIAIRQGV